MGKQALDDEMHGTGQMLAAMLGCKRRFRALSSRFKNRIHAIIVEKFFSERQPRCGARRRD